MTEYESFAEIDTEEPRAGKLRRKGQRPVKRKKSGGLMVAFAWLVALLTSGVMCWTVIIILNPQSPFNPFGVAEEPTATVYVIPSVTPTPPTLPPTWTASPTAIEGPTLTPIVLPSATPTFVETVNIEIQTAGPPTATLSLFQYVVDGTPRYEANRNGDGCAWMSIAGAVYDVDRRPKMQVGILVRGEHIEWLEWTGSNRNFGASGYEIPLGINPVVGSWTVQLFDRNAMPLSSPITVRTSASCRENVVIVNFIQNH